MAGRTARKPPEDGGGAIPKKDFAGAVRTWRNDIKPALSSSGENLQEASTGYKHIKKNCHIQPQAAKLAFKLESMEDAKRDDFLRCFTGLLKELNIPLESNDLVDQAEGKGQPPAAKPRLVTVPKSDGVDADLVDAAETPTPEPAAGTGAAAIAAMKTGAGDFTEASAEELAQQEGRGEPNDS